MIITGNVEKMENATFPCSGIEEVIFEEGLKSLGNNTFYNC